MHISIFYNFESNFSAILSEATTPAPLQGTNPYTQAYIILNNNRLKTASLNKKLVVWSFGRLGVGGWLHKTERN